MRPLARAWATVERVRAIQPALLLLAVMVFIVQIGVAVMLPLLPLYARSLGASPTVLGMLTSVFAVTNAAGQFLTGFLAERFAMRRLLAAGIGSYALGNFLIAGATSAGALIFFRGFAGIGGGVMIIGERLYLTQLVDASRLAFANGVLSAAASAGSVTGPAIGGLLAALGDLRTPFLLVAVTSTLATVAALFLPRPRTEVPATEQPLPADTPAVDAQAADVPAADVLATDAPASDAPPIGVPAISSRRRLAILLLAQLSLMTSFGAFITIYAPFAEERLGWGTPEIGLVFAMFGLGAIVFGPWLGRQADRRGRRIVAVLSCLPVLAFSVAYWAEAPRVLLYLSAVFAGAGVTGVTASWYALLSDATGGGRRGRQFGTIAALGNMGIIVGATLAAQLWELLDDVSVGFAVASVASVACAGAFALLPRDRPAGELTGEGRILHRP